MNKYMPIVIKGPSSHEMGDALGACMKELTLFEDCYYFDCDPLLDFIDANYEQV